MIVDCMTCPVRGQRCDDCVVALLLAAGSDEHVVSGQRASNDCELDAAEDRVVSMFVSAGLVNARTASTLRARREDLQDWRAVREVG